MSKFNNSEKGQGLVEYAIILLLVAFVVIAILVLLAIYVVIPVAIPWIKGIWEAAMITSPMLFV